MTDSHPKALDLALQDIAKELGYDCPHVEVAPVHTTGAGYTSHLYRGKISAPKKEDLRFFAKVAALNDNARSQLPSSIFYTELYTYKRLADIFRKIEDKHNVAPQHRFVFPTLYGHKDTYLEEVIVMQDLSAEGFTMQDRFTSFNWEYASAAMQQIARFHALSIAMQQDFPEDFEEVKETYKLKDPGADGHLLEGAVRDSALKSIELINEVHRERLQTYLKNYLPKAMATYYDIPPRPVLNHGDLKMSNIMHRERKDGTIEMLVIDYQILHLASSVKDLMHFIFTGSDATFRAQHYHHLLDNYYQQMCLALARLHLDPEEVFPREDFDADLKEDFRGVHAAILNHPPDGFNHPPATWMDIGFIFHLNWNGHLGLLFALHTLPVITVAEEQAPALGGALSLDSFKDIDASQLCRDRLNEVVDDYVRWGLI